jgi:prepilin-type N-terminal cleavage/methylation domain-containing protein
MPTSTPAPSSEAAPARHAPGFTLLELTIVLLVLGLVASFIVPRVRDADAAALAASASRLAAATRYLYDEAAFRQVPMRLHLDLDRGVYWVTAFDPDPDVQDFVPDEGMLSRPTALPGSVAFLDVVLPALGTVTEGVVFAQFAPEGWVDPLVIHLRGRDGAYATLAIEPLTGRTRVAEGYLEPAAPAALERAPSGGARRRMSGRS